MGSIRNVRISAEEFNSLVKHELGSYQFTRKEARDLAEKYHVCIPSGVLSKENSPKRGYFNLEENGYGVAEVSKIVSRASLDTPVVGSVVRVEEPEKPAREEVAVAVAKTVAVEESEEEYVKLNSKANAYESGFFVPKKNSFYVKNGNLHDDLADIMKSGFFFPAYVTGLSGNGKTFTVDQVGAELGREIVRVNITASTDEDDLVGGFRLVNGDTVWEDGPVLVAMKRGAILLLDEIDLGTNKIMCLQPILEGNPIYVKKINEKVYPKSGFNVVATGNTKGKGDDSGVMAGTNILSEALLDRFSITLEQEYPEADVEVSIMERAYEILSKGSVDSDAKSFISVLSKFAATVRENYFNDNIADVISTRRLVEMVKSYLIYGGNRRKVVKYAISRFEDKDAIYDLYKTYDGDIDGVAVAPEPTSDPSVSGF
jgi:hypothetical protein